jgi:hypothetical protein
LGRKGPFLNKNRVQFWVDQTSPVDFRTSPELF